jgi:hypothetical protein
MYLIFPSMYLIFPSMYLIIRARIGRTTRLTKEFRFRRHEKRNLVSTPVMDWNPLKARWRKFFNL